ncbi:MAG: zinc ribbon domain-containing protein [Methanospirillum sp.]
MNETNRICQSCSMPLAAPGDRGTEGDGTPSAFYCRYCYQNGAFTEPTATIETMAARGGEMMSGMFEIPLDRARGFTLQQLRPLLRWSGRLIPSCGSCGMPLERPDDAGTEADGSPSERYCTHCYRNGAFVQPDLTRDRMVEEYAPLLAAELGMPLEQARAMVTAFTATLPRWR